MLISLLIILPLLAGIGLICVKNNKSLGFVGTAVSIYLFIYTLFLLFTKTPVALYVQHSWFSIGEIRTNIALSLNGLGAAMVLLTTLVYALLFIYFYTIKKNYSNAFYGLLLIAFGGLNGVLLAQDLVLFYFFWYIVLITIFIMIVIERCGNSRITANTTFFLFAILAYMLMLAVNLFIGFQLHPESFLIVDVTKVTTGLGNMLPLTWLFLLAFAVK